MSRATRVLLLEPDFWRFHGIGRYLTENAGMEILGEPQAERSLDVAARQHDPPPDAVMLAHKLIDDYGQEMIDRLNSAHVKRPILVHGDNRSLEITASVLQRGAAGYFVLSSPPHQLVEALWIVSNGRIWASREAVLLAARRPAAAQERNDGSAEERMLISLLREGLANKEIASRLGIAEVTVKARLSRLYRRHGVASRLQLLAAIVRDDGAADDSGRGGRAR